MKKLIFKFLAPAVLATAVMPVWAGNDYIMAKPYMSTSKKLKSITPGRALQRLMEGNKRFVDNKPVNRDLLSQAKKTSIKGQFPTSVILSCMDSRGTPELVLDQGLGDVFTVRLAGNVIDADQLGGMEYATKIVGSKLIVVMGHTQCGAVGGACSLVRLGNLTQLLAKIQPAVQSIKDSHDGKANCNDPKVIDAIAKQNVLDMIGQIPKDSPIINEMLMNKKVMIVGAMHHIESGKVEFFDANGVEIK